MKFAAALLAGAAMAQLQSEHSYKARSGPVTKQGLSMASMDIESEMANALKNQNIHGGYEFARVNDVDVDMARHGEWASVEGGRVWQHNFALDNAKSMSFTLDSFHMCDGCAMYVSSEEEVAGAFTQNWTNGMFATRHVTGNNILMEVFVPTGADDTPVVHVSKVATRFRELGEKAGNCNINAVCIDQTSCNPDCSPTDRSCSVECTFHDGDDSSNDGQWADRSWWNEVNASGAMQSGFGSRYCSGSLINAQGDVNAPVFLTAHHCIGSSPGTDLILFGFRAEDCSETNDNNGPTDKTVGNLSILTSDSRVDDSYLSVGERIPDAWNTYLAGWEARESEIEEVIGMVGIHNPSSSITKISHSQLAPTLDSWSGAQPYDHWRVGHWTEATTEPGSSGSPLYQRDTKRIIGQLHGGSASCPAYNGYDTYGAVSTSYDRSERFLGSTPYADGQSTTSFYKSVEQRERREHVLKARAF